MPPQIHIIGLDMLSALHGQTAQIIDANIAAFNLARDVGTVTVILAAKLVREHSSLIVRNQLNPS